MNEKYITYAKKFVDNVLDKAKDVFNDPPSPLLADVLTIEDGLPYRQNAQVTKSAIGNHEVISSNLLYQQQFLRTLTLLSRMTGDEKYHEHAKKTVQYYYDHLLMKSGRMPWGNHHDIDLLTLKDNGSVHEIKCQYPYYDLFFETDALKTSRMIKSFWRGHLINIKNFDISRHASEFDRFGRALETTEGLDEFFETKIPDVAPFQPVRGLTFLNTSSDLCYGSLKYYQHTGDERALLWAEALNGMYLKHRHPKTGIDPYTYGILITGTGGDRCGDRGYVQMFDDFGPAAYEGHMLFGGANDNYGGHLQLLYEYYRLGGEIGKRMFAEGVKGAESYLKYAFDPEDGKLCGILSDGTNLHGYKVSKDGYFGTDPGFKVPMNPSHIISFLNAAYYGNSSILWDYIRQALIKYGVGDIGKNPGDLPDLNYDVKITDSLYVACMYKFFDITGKEEFLRLAEKIMNNVIEERWVEDGYFRSRRRPELCEIDSFVPLNMLALDAYREGKSDLIPDVIYCRRLASYHR